MAETLSIATKNGLVTIKLGTKVTLNKDGKESSLGSIGDKAVVIDIQRKGSYVMDTMLTLVREGEPNATWGNLRGTVANGMGLHMYLTAAMECFDFPAFPKKLRISKDLVFKGRNLKGLKCKFLHHFRGGDHFVEFEKDVGGCSCDGLGKKGRCIVVDQSFLTNRKEPTPKKEKEAKKDT